MSLSFQNYLSSGGPYQGYAYAYPHKSAYRRLDPARPLDEAWALEDRSALFLYAHIPFCEMRCGFCNLFTTAGGTEGLVARYLDALQRQAERLVDVLGPDAQFSRGAVGGGTPTYLDAAELGRLFSILRAFQWQPAMPLAFEMSPGTVDPDKLALLREHGVTRISMGVQSFHKNETQSLGRPQKIEEVRQALQWMKQAEFPVMNVDLIYGMPGQTCQSLLDSIKEALSYDPQELFLYPLYVRPLTGLHRLGREALDERTILYRAAIAWLRERGWRQISMRLFRAPHFSPPEGPEYCCQEDGMVGLGAGARSYTSRLHYSSEYGVGKSRVMNVLSHYCNLDAGRFGFADYGCELSEEEQRRRYLIKSLLRSDGLNLEDWNRRFKADVLACFSEVNELLDCGAVEMNGTTLRLTAQGFEWSDAIGPWLYSDSVRGKMQTFELS